MPRASEIKQRQRERAIEAGSRWRAGQERRAVTLRRLRTGGPEAAESPGRVAKYLAREAAKTVAYAAAGVTTAAFVERRVGSTLDLDDAPPNDAARIAGVPVGRIVELDDRGGAGEGFATGFLISAGLLITNHHVFATASECAGCGVQFGYERVNGVLLAGAVFALDPRSFFLADAALDFAIVGVMPTGTTPGEALGSFKTLKLIPVTGKILVGQPISIIQYPDGGPKKYGVRNNDLLNAPADTDLFLQYTTDTLPGSSGSPAFNKDWEVVGLHHSGVPEVKDGQVMTNAGTPWQQGMPDADIHWVGNEGVRISCICARLRASSVAPEHKATLRGLLATFVDDLSGLPAVESHMEQSQTVGGTPLAGGGGGGVSVVVNGTANFYFGAASLHAAQPQQAAVVVAPKVDVVEKKLRFDPNYDNRPGYDPDFIGLTVPVPGISAGRMGDILKDNGKALVLDYHHYSLVMNKTRRLQMWSAVNVDYTPTKRRHERKDFGTDTWIADPRVAGKFQIEDQELYDPAKKFDRGHIVRRDDTAWGETEEEEILSNSDSFHWTNCTPQHEQFNRDQFGFHGLWGGLENQIQRQAKNVGQRMCILAGPILDDANDIDHDFGGGAVKVPRRFWKVLVVAENAGAHQAALRAYGFILDQSNAIEEFGLEKFSAGKFDVFQQSLDSVAAQTGVTFAKELTDADAMAGAPDEARRKVLESLADVRI